ncbi:hypothetical protein AADG42_18345 [Ammonicoccus fulvus]|uniref:Uncharacterized protein n=1 Tax=Ammonicoccus fulvus TaxID=3138240 RepID=A0ABZ3FSX0_9ACTN
MRQRVHARVGAQAGRESERELGVIDDGFREYARIAPGDLAPMLGEPPDRRHLGPRVGGRHRKNRRSQLLGDRLRHPHRRASADRDQEIGVRVPRRRDTTLRGLDRDMHDDLVERADQARTQGLSDLRDHAGLVTTTDEHNAIGAEQLDLGHGVTAGTRAEDNAGGGRGMDEAVHH